MTRKMYLEDSHLTNCESTVLSCVPCGTGYDVVLNQTVFFENAGGQPCDLGTIGPASVIACDEKDGVLLHHTDKPLLEGRKYPVSIDWSRRFDFMQQHTGEHILSYAFYHLFDIHNVGFHLSEEYTTIDLDALVTDEQADAAEHLANEYVMRNLSVSARVFETLEDLSDSGIQLRKQAEGIQNPIRIVSIEGADSCTCCAPHCNTTGEIGIILIRDRMAYKGGTRMTLYCGFRALDYIRRMRSVTNELSRSASTSFDHLPDVLDKLERERNAARRSEQELLAKVVFFMSEDLKKQATDLKGTSFVFNCVTGLAPDQLRSLALQTLKEKKSITVLFSRNVDSLYYVLTCTKDILTDMGEFCKIVNASTKGKGGGRGQMAQGSAVAYNDLAETLAQLRKCFESMILHG